MTYVLKNQHLELHIDDPSEGYNFSRFDWSGKIKILTYNNVVFGVHEKIDNSNENIFGKGFYNEFGIDTALGFDETTLGDWFHKIGVGLLKKHKDQYLFHEEFEIKPATFNVQKVTDALEITCISEIVNGYGYILKKKITLNEVGFSINYSLENTGEKEIITDEYVHNFMAIDNQLIGNNYSLTLPFQLKPENFDAVVNPENVVEIKESEIAFNGTPEQQLFYSNLSGGNYRTAFWELRDHNSNLSISEEGSFKTNKVNLWGTRHVISPELFHTIKLKPSETTKWSRSYRIKH